MVTPEQLEQLGVALNEANVVTFELEEDIATVKVALSVFLLTEDSQESEKIWLYLSKVSRVAVSLRKGLWNNPEAPVVPLALHELTAVVESFDGQAIYGWRFFDLPDEESDIFMSRLSLDWVRPGRQASHWMRLFQEGFGFDERYIELRVWFEDLGVFDSQREPMPLEAFIARGQAWWAAFYKGDPRTHDDEGLQSMVDYINELDGHG